MYFKEASNYFNNVLKDEGIELSDKFKENLLGIMSEMCGYSEEDHKIRPQIILGVNIDSFFRSIPSKSYFIMYKDTLEGEQLSRYFKSLALFCDNGWYIFVNAKKDFLEYGIFRRYTGIDGERFEDYFKSSFFSEDGRMIILNAISNSEILIVRDKEDDIIISQKFIPSISDAKGYYNDFKELASDIVKCCAIENQDYLKCCFLKLFRNLPLKIHGTIMLVVKDGYEIPKNILSGIEINPIIDFEKIFEESKIIGSYEDSENVYSLVGALYEMLNTDGITVITNKAKVLYYNAFYQGTIPNDIRGGARKRTALGIVGNENLFPIAGWSNLL